MSETPLQKAIDSVKELISDAPQLSGPLQEVLVQCDDRLEQIETEKAEAVTMVQDAMCQLETLSNELHEGAGDEGGEGAGDEDAAEECKTSAPHEAT